MIPVDWDEILSRFVSIPAVLYILHKLYLVLRRKKLHPGKARSLFCAVGIPLCRDKIFSCNRFSPP